MLKKLNPSKAIDEKPALELWDVTYHKRSHNVTFHPTQMNFPALTADRRPILNFPTLEG